MNNRTNGKEFAIVRFEPGNIYEITRFQSILDELSFEMKQNLENFLFIILSALFITYPTIIAKELFIIFPMLLVLEMKEDVKQKSLECERSNRRYKPVSNN